MLGKAKVLVVVQRGLSALMLNVVVGLAWAILQRACFEGGSSAAFFGLGRGDPRGTHTHSALQLDSARPFVAIGEMTKASKDIWLKRLFVLNVLLRA